MQRQKNISNEIREVNMKQQKELDEQKNKIEENEEKIKGLSFEYRIQAIQLAILIKRDMASTSRHETFPATTEQIRKIIIELVELFGAQGRLRLFRFKPGAS
ncbi:hypothetical protein Hanom_Chr07g00636321 [Helianthus anomalus]